MFVVDAAEQSVPAGSGCSSEKRQFTLLKDGISDDFNGKYAVLFPF